MSQIISWCNENNGFLTALLALLSLCISTLAIVVSILTARIPYQKKIRLFCSDYFSNVEDGLCVAVVNLGQAPVKIEMMGFFIAGQQVFQPDRLPACQQIIKHAEIVELRIEKNTLRAAVEQIGDFQEVYLYMCDSEGKLHKRYFCNKDAFIKKINCCRH